MPQVGKRRSRTATAPSGSSQCEGVQGLRLHRCADAARSIYPDASYIYIAAIPMPHVRN